MFESVTQTVMNLGKAQMETPGMMNITLSHISIESISARNITQRTIATIY
jgi:hypothetical protein